MRFEYTYHDLFKRFNIEKTYSGFDINLWKLSLRFIFTKKYTSQYFEELLKAELSDVKINIYEQDEDSVSMDVVSDLWPEGSHRFEKLDLVMKILEQNDRNYFARMTVICPVTYYEFNNCRIK